MARSNSKKPESLSDVMMDDLFVAEHQPSHSQKWDGLKAGDAAFARQAVIKAQQLREAGADPGDAYLQGVADDNARHNREQLIEETRSSLAALPETPDRS